MRLSAFRRDKTVLLGCIADDFTGATDLANTLSRHGMRTVQIIGEPTGLPPDTDAIVIALKSRTIPAGEAVAQSLAACRWLKQHGARQIYFKYCSTFDSTDAGNIGPVADALLDELGSDFTIACPAFPENGRTIYMGHLFVGQVLLSESSMRHHPLTPMHDSNLVNVLARQTPHKTGLVALCDGEARSRAPLLPLSPSCSRSVSAMPLSMRLRTLTFIISVTPWQILRLSRADRVLPLACRKIFGNPGFCPSATASSRWRRLAVVGLFSREAVRRRRWRRWPP